MVDADLSDTAERLTRRRSRLLPVLAVFYVGQQVSFFSRGNSVATVDHFKIGAWAVMSAALLILLVTGGFWLRKPELRAMLNDEGTRAHRADALGTGFVVAMITGIIVYVINSGSQMTSREVIHLIVSLGIAAALVRFGFLERRAHQLV
ncbi:MAG: hypothetical protein ABIR63_04885 [Sphingomicrobium sp.]